MFKIVIIFLTLVLAAPAAQAPSPHYAAPYGAGAVCDEAQPCTLSTALAQGGEIQLLPGTYRGDLVIAQPNTLLRSVPGARAQIDGGLTISGAGATIQGLEIFDASWQTRTTATAAQQARTVNVQTPGVTIRDNWIHDLAGGIYAFSDAPNLIAERNVLYNIGYGAALGRGTGHAVYLQNSAAIGAKTIRQNVIVNGYGFGMHAYGSAANSARLERMTFDRNVVANNRWLTGGGQPLRDVRIADNRLWKSRMQVGYSNHANEDVAVTGNWVGLEMLQMQWVLTPTVALNRVVTTGQADAYVCAPPIGGGAWDANAYWRVDAAQMGAIDGQGFFTLPAWRATTGWDATSTFTQSLPLENWVDVQSWAPHRGLATVYNWTSAPTVTIDLAPLGLTPGASYRLVNAQDPAEQQAFQAGAPVSVPSSGWTVATPYGASAPLAAWDARILVFLVEPLWA